MVAGATEKLRLVTSVLVLPYRNPVLTAKMVASLDVLSGGRVTLGVGVGWLKEEFEALDSPDFDARGAVTDEWITIFKQLWTQSPASFNGQFYNYADIRCEPFPLQKPHPPIWVGGHSRAALRRTARHGAAQGAKQQGDRPVQSRHQMSGQREQQQCAYRAVTDQPAHSAADVGQLMQAQRQATLE